MNFDDSASIGVVVIGRDEGERLRRCLVSVRCQVSCVVYVDSGSGDGSVELAQSVGAEVVALDTDIPFTAARARNAGFERLRQIAPDTEFVQFVDGDCELAADWLPAARHFLAQHPEVVCVCGRLHERFPERSVYNRLCDLEWDRPAGAADACGGISMMRGSSFSEIGGFRSEMVAGEEPELCLRMREKGGKVWRLAMPMALHDADMHRFSQWWKRSRRSGFSYAQRASVRSGIVERPLLRQIFRACVWGGVLPLATLLGVGAWGAAAIVLLAAYPIQVLRLARQGDRPSWIALQRAFFIVLGKFPEFLGLLQFWLGRRDGRVARAFDYKA